MTIYVDDMRREGRVHRGGGRSVTGRWSHLMGDDPTELGEFVASLGLRPEWVQQSGTPQEHYDIVENLRRRAIDAGAVLISYPHGTGNLIATKRLQTTALNAAGRGWHAFPLRPGTKVPAVRRWEQEATTEAEQIRQLWSAELRRRDGWHIVEPRNVGIACGPSGLVVLDLDLAKPSQDRTRWPVQWRDHDVASGADVLGVLTEQAGQPVPETYVVATPSGGRHLYFAASDDVPVRNSTGRLVPMIDVRGNGGYVVAAGSRLHPRPHRDEVPAATDDPAYRLVKDVHPADLPSWLIDLIAGDRHRDDQTAARLSRGRTRSQPTSPPNARYGAAALWGEADRVRSARVGQRNHTLNSAAYSLGQLVAAGALDQASAVQALTDAAAEAGLEAAEIASTIESGLSAGLNLPRALPEHRSRKVKTETARAEASKTTADPHLVLDAAIEQASAAVAQLEATRAGTQEPSYQRAADVAAALDRPAYRAEPKVAR